MVADMAGHGVFLDMCFLQNEIVQETCPLAVHGVFIYVFVTDSPGDLPLGCPWCVYLCVCYR